MWLSDVKYLHTVVQPSPPPIPGARCPSHTQLLPHETGVPCASPGPAAVLPPCPESHSQEWNPQPWPSALACFSQRAVGVSEPPSFLRLQGAPVVRVYHLVDLSVPCGQGSGFGLSGTVLLWTWCDASVGVPPPGPEGVPLGVGLPVLRGPVQPLAWLVFLGLYISLLHGDFFTSLQHLFFHFFLRVPFLG